MASRQEEKERRRREREEAEREARAAEARRKRLGIVLGGVVAIAAVAIVVFAVTRGGGSGDPATTASGSSDLPAVKIRDLNEAAKAAGCKVSKFPSEGRLHSGEDQAGKYKTNPPTSGTHDPTAAREGIYGEGNAPDLEQSVHALEHGRINIQYRKGSPKNRIEQLSRLFEEKNNGISGYLTLVFENQTNMPYDVAATAWTRSLTCPKWNDRVFDAIRAFRRDFSGKGPEPIPSEFQPQ